MKKPLDEQRLMTWYEDALDLENACRYWEKAGELLRRKRLKIKKMKSDVITQILKTNLPSRSFRQKKSKSLRSCAPSRAVRQRSAAPSP